jgi:hypothetical protein
VPDVGLAEKTLDLKLNVDIDEAIRRTLAWFQANRVTVR